MAQVSSAAGKVKRNVAPPDALLSATHAAAVSLDDRAADRQSHAHAGFLGGEEGLKQIWNDVVLEAGAGVGHLDLDHVVRDAGVGDDELAPRRLRHRFQRVAEQIDQHLLDLHPVGEDEIGAGIEA